MKGERERTLGAIQTNKPAGAKRRRLCLLTTWRRWRRGKRSETLRTLTERHLGWQLAPDNPVVVAAGKKTSFNFFLKLYKFLSSKFIGTSA